MRATPGLLAVSRLKRLCFGNPRSRILANVRLNVRSHPGPWCIQVNCSGLLVRFLVCGCFVFQEGLSVETIRKTRQVRGGMFVSCLLLMILVGVAPAGATSFFQVTNLASDQSGVAPTTDPQLKNAWGI